MLFLRFFKGKILICFLLLLFIPTTFELIYADTPDMNLIEKYEKLNLAINNGKGYANHTNEKGTLAWAESYLLESYLDMYEATKNKKYLDIFVEQVDLVISNLDINRGLKDYIPNFS